VFLVLVHLAIDKGTVVLSPSEFQVLLDHDSVTELSPLGSCARLCPETAPWVLGTP
jgi:hypothetical protein